MEGTADARQAGNTRTRVIRGGRLIDGNGGPVTNDPVIVVEGKRIKAVGTKGQIPEPAGAEIIDASRYTLMPGLIDTHLHLAAFNCSTFSNYRVSIWEVTPQLQMLYMLFHAQMCMEMGFTTLRDLGRATSRGPFVLEACAVRDAINAGIHVGPRLLVCGRPIITGSHLDLTLPRAAARNFDLTFTADGPWALRALAREHLRAGADLLKTSVSGGGGTQDEEPDVRNMTLEELEAVVDEGHAFHKPVAAHCFTAESHKMCVRAKVDTIEHMVFHDRESIAMIKDSGIPVTPTLSHRTDHAIEVRARIGTPRNVLDKMKKIQPYTFETFKVMHQAGIKIAMGTDLGPEPEMGSNAAELELYVKLGMTPMEAIRSATKSAAEALWLGKDLGTIENGKLADILAIDGDPSRDISALCAKDKIRMVMKEGEPWVDKVSAQQRRVVNFDPGSWKIIDNA
jgi:imidazolonepropionase-like amidohydrolase